eukprot:scaffold484532_cov15-Prasinocladus_malaysianus.AAC.1
MKRNGTKPNQPGPCESIAAPRVARLTLRPHRGDPAALATDSRNRSSSLTLVLEAAREGLDGDGGGGV